MTIYRTTVTSRAALEAFLRQFQGRLAGPPLVRLSMDGEMARVSVWVKEQP